MSAQMTNLSTGAAVWTNTVDEEATVGQRNGRDEVLHAALENKVPTRAEEGVEAYYQTTREDDPNTILFFAVFSSQAGYDAHVQTEHAKRTFAALQGKLAGTPERYIGGHCSAA